MHHIQASTQDYFRAIGESLGSWELNPSAIYLLLALVATVLASSILVHMYNKARRKKLPDPSSSFVHSDPEDIQLFLQHALQDRSKFEVSFNPSMKRPRICSLLDFTSDSLLLEMPIQEQPPANWQDKQVHIYFSIPATQNQRLYFSFLSQIREFSASQDGYCHLQVLFPQKLEQKQRRGAFRLEPGLAQTSRIQVWRRTFANQPALPRNMQSLGRPLLEYPTKEVEPEQQLLLLNISALGLRLWVPNTLRKKSGLDPEQTEDLFLFLELKNPDSDDHSRFCLVCRKRNFHLDPMSRDLELGLQIIRQGSEPDPQSPGLIWQNVDPGQGVHELGDWVIRQHLKMFREKGLTSEA